MLQVTDVAKELMDTKRTQNMNAEQKWEKELPWDNKYFGGKLTQKRQGRSISLREASHSRCSIPSFLSSIKPCSTEHNSQFSQQYF